MWFDCMNSPTRKAPTLSQAPGPRGEWLEKAAKTAAYDNFRHPVNPNVTFFVTSRLFQPRDGVIHGIGNREACKSRGGPTGRPLILVPNGLAREKGQRVPAGGASCEGKARSMSKRQEKAMSGKRYCNKCGGEIAFKKLANGKWCPTEPDGSEHWDICKQRRRQNRPTVSTKNKITNPSNRTKFYSDPDIPPWDESLGEFQEL